MITYSNSNDIKDIYIISHPPKNKPHAIQSLDFIDVLGCFKIGKLFKKLYFVVVKQIKIPFKNSSMSKILTKKTQTQLSDYFSFNSEMSKPETRCLKDMVLGVLKSKSVFVNQIAASLREPLKLKYVCKRLSAQYLKEDYVKKVIHTHLENVGISISKDNFILMDGTDISKKHIGDKGCWFFDRGADGGILKDFFISQCSQTIIRLKKNTKVCRK